MAGQKELKTKINSLRNIEKITSAMGMIAMSRLQRYTAIQSASHAFLEQTGHIITRMSQYAKQKRNVFLHGHEGTTSCDIVIFTSDRGLCGPFNHETVKAAAALVKSLKSTVTDFSFFIVGKKGLRYARQYGMKDPHILQLDTKTLHTSVVADAVSLFLDRYRNGQSGALYLVYSQYVSSLQQKPVARQIFPITPFEGAEQQTQTEYITEPSSSTLVDHAASVLLSAYMYDALVESVTGEHAARMTAMQNASGNCETLIDTYVTTRNRMRQSSITTELTEIIGGMEAQ